MNLRRATGTLLLAVCAVAPGIVPAWAATTAPAGPGGAPPAAPDRGLPQLPSPCELLRCPAIPAAAPTTRAEGLAARVLAPVAKLPALPRGPQLGGLGDVLPPLTGLLRAPPRPAHRSRAANRDSSAADRPAERQLPSPGSILAPARPEVAVASPGTGQAPPPLPLPRSEAERPVPVPMATSGTDAAVLAPIAAGLFLTGIAMYKHRGLPGGH